MRDVRCPAIGGFWFMLVGGLVCMPASSVKSLLAQVGRAVKGQKVQSMTLLHNNV